MIPKDFDYVASPTLSEAIQQYTAFTRSDKNAIYYGGGTEIITLARLNQLNPDAVIDIKPVPENRVMEIYEGKLILGGGVTLSQITDQPLIRGAFPLLQVTANEIADRTARNKITLGGNICGQIFYREAVLPFLVCDSRVRTYGPRGGKERSIHQLFYRNVRLESGEFIVQTLTDHSARMAPFIHIKRRKAGEVGYPIVTAASIRVHNRIRIALSGVCPFPFRSSAFEAALQREGASRRQRINEAIQIIPPTLILDDFEASRAYRTFVLRTVLEEILQRLEGV